MPKHVIRILFVFVLLVTHRSWAGGIIQAVNQRPESLAVLREAARASGMSVRVTDAKTAPLNAELLAWEVRKGDDSSLTKARADQIQAYVQSGGNLLVSCGLLTWDQLYRLTAVCPTTGWHGLCGRRVDGEQRVNKGAAVVRWNRDMHGGLDLTAAGSGITTAYARFIRWNAAFSDTNATRRLGVTSAKDSSSRSRTKTDVLDLRRRPTEKPARQHHDRDSTHSVQQGFSRPRQPSHSNLESSLQRLECRPVGLLLQPANRSESETMRRRDFLRYVGQRPPRVSSSCTPILPSAHGTRPPAADSQRRRCSLDGENALGAKLPAEQAFPRVIAVLAHGRL